MFGRQNFMRKSAALCALAALCFTLSAFSPSLDGRAAVAAPGEFPAGLFAKTVGYLPGDSILVSNVAAGRTLDILVVGALDPSEGVAILLSPEAAAALGIQRNADIIVRITRRSGQLDEAVSGTAVIADASTPTVSDDELALADESRSESPEIIEQPVAQEEIAHEDNAAETQDDFIADLSDAQNNGDAVPPVATDDSRMAFENDKTDDAADLSAQDAAISETETPFDEHQIVDAPFSDETVADTRVTDEPSVEVAQTDAPIGEGAADGKNVVSDKVIVEYVPVESEERPAVAETPQEETVAQAEETDADERLDNALPPDPFVESEERPAVAEAQEEETDAAERFDADALGELDEETEQVAAEPQGAPVHESVVEDAPPINDDALTREVVAEGLPVREATDKVVVETLPAESDGRSVEREVSDKVIVEIVPEKSEEKPAIAEPQTEETIAQAEAADESDLFNDDVPPEVAVQTEKTDAAERLDNDLPPDPFAENEERTAVAEAQEEETDAAECFDADALGELDEQKEQIAVETQDETPALESEAVAEDIPAESEERPAVAEAQEEETDAAERFDADALGELDEETEQVAAEPQDAPVQENVAEDVPPINDDALTREVVAEGLPAEREVSDKVIVETLPVENEEQPAVADAQMQETETSERLGDDVPPEVAVQAEETESEETNAAERLDDVPPDPFAESDGQPAIAETQAEETDAPISERFDADAPGELDEQKEEIAAETKDETPALESESVAETLPPLEDNAPVEENIAENLPAEREEQPAIAETQTEETNAAERLDDLPPNPLAEDVPDEIEERPTLAEETETPISDESAADEGDVYEAIVLEPASDRAPPHAGEPVATDGGYVAAIDASPVAETVPVERADAEEIAALETQSAGSASLPSDLSRYVVRDISSLEQGKYYVQIAALSDADNIRNTVSRYESNYPLVLVPLASGRAVQVMIGPLGVDEYGVVMERFKSYGFADAFLRQRN